MQAEENTSEKRRCDVCLKERICWLSKELSCNHFSYPPSCLKIQIKYNLEKLTPNCFGSILFPSLNFYPTPEYTAHFQILILRFVSSGASLFQSKRGRTIFSSLPAFFLLWQAKGNTRTPTAPPSEIKMPIHSGLPLTIQTTFHFPNPIIRNGRWMNLQWN